MALQFLWTPFSGAITDKFGRKRTTLITDIIAWSIPCLIWAVAQDFRYFLVAAAINSLWRITHNSWGCLLVEGTNPNLLVEVYSLIYIAGLMAAFFSPLTAILIDQFSLVPTMRFLYFLAFVMMTAKFLIMNAMVTETDEGLVRMEETRHQSIFAIVGESRSVLQAGPAYAAHAGHRRADGHRQHQHRDHDHLLADPGHRELADPGPVSLALLPGPLDHDAALLLPGHAQSAHHERLQADGLRFYRPDPQLGAA